MESSSSRTLPSTVVDQIADRLRDLESGAPSVNVAVFDRDGLLHQHGVGHYDGGEHVPDAATRYRIASMSKSFTAAAVMSLSEQKLLSLDDVVTKHLPDFTDYVDASGKRVPVTIRMLITHTSGLPEDNPWADHHLDIDRVDAVALVTGDLAYTAAPDEHWQYSNLAYTALGLIVEEASGSPFAEFVTSNLLTPLGLNETRYNRDDYDDPAHAQARFAEAYSSFDGGTTWRQREPVRSAAAAAIGGLYSTVGDISRWCSWLSAAFDDTNVNDRVLTRHSRRLMQRPWAGYNGESHSDDTPGAWVSSGYGLGIVVEDDRDYGRFCHHAGGLPGYSSSMRWHLASGLGVVIFFNTEDVTATRHTAEILRDILAEVQPPAQVPPVWPETAAAAERVDLAILDMGRLDSVTDLFSANIESNCPLEVRNARLTDAIGQVGGLRHNADVPTDRFVRSTSAAQLVWSIPGHMGRLECRVDMTMSYPLEIQRIEIRADRLGS